MIDPRFVNAGAVPVVPGYGTQQLPAQYQHHHHRHHRHHKHKVRNDGSPVSLDESIHKVDHSQPHHFQQNDGVQLNGGYGVPYGAGGYETGVPYGATSFYPQQQYGGGNFGYGNQYQGASYGQGQFGSGLAGQPVKQHRRHHRHHRHHTTEATNNRAGADQAQAVPEQLIGQRSSSVLGKEQLQGSPIPLGEGEASGEQGTRRRHHRRHHHHHHHSGEQTGFGQTHQSRPTHQHTSATADGYGHINDELIFIERGNHSPHRQEPPPGYEYKGKIEVQNFDRTIHTQSHGQSSVVPPPSVGPCPPGWQQMVLSAGGSCGPCPSGGIPYAGQLVGGGSAVQTGGYGIGGGYGSFGAGGSLPPNCQIVADYVFGSNSGGIISSGGSGFTSGYQQTGGTNYGEQSQNQQVQEQVSGRATIIEVWQKRAKTEAGERSRSRTPTKAPAFDFDRFRNDILGAVERAVARGGPGEAQLTGRDGGTQTETRVIERIKETAGEVRVIVQPIQPVFYMPRQTGTTPGPQIASAPIIQQTSSAPHVVYVPRNVYVPVIKPVFVPRERIIVRPQVIHVARPVLVDRPVPVTQRPIIIDRERPIPVPVRGGQAAQAGGSKIVREEYVYRDNLPVAYGGRCAEFAGGVNYGYMPTQPEHQYANSSTHETASLYQTQGQTVNLNIPRHVQQSRTSSRVEVQQGGGDSYHGSYSNLTELNNAADLNVGQLNQDVFQQSFEQSAQVGGGVGAGGPTQIEILDAAVNPHWQKTDQSTLMRRYGRPAFEIVHKSQEVEQQMYNELRQRTSSGGVVRSVSTASYGSGYGTGLLDGGITQY